VASRTRSLARIAAGKVVTDRTEWVDPDRCRPWRLHNRDLDHLNDETCRDLIDAFLSAKRQRIPAIVRRLRDDPDHDSKLSRASAGGGRSSGFGQTIIPTSSIWSLFKT